MTRLRMVTRALLGVVGVSGAFYVLNHLTGTDRTANETRLTLASGGIETAGSGAGQAKNSALGRDGPLPSTKDDPQVVSPLVTQQAKGTEEGGGRRTDRRRRRRVEGEPPSTEDDSQAMSSLVAQRANETTEEGRGRRADRRRRRRVEGGLPSAEDDPQAVSPPVAERAHGTEEGGNGRDEQSSRPPTRGEMGQKAPPQERRAALEQQRAALLAAEEEHRAAFAKQWRVLEERRAALEERRAALLTAEEERRAAFAKRRAALLAAEGERRMALDKRPAALKERGAAGVSAAPLVPPELLQRAERVGRRRRQTALAVVSAICLIALLFWSVGWDVPTRAMLRGEDAFLPFQYLIMFLLIHRLWQLGKQLRRWLFPDPKAPPGQRGGIG